MVRSVVLERTARSGACPIAIKPAEPLLPARCRRCTDRWRPRSFRRLAAEKLIMIRQAPGLPQ